MSIRMEKPWQPLTAELLKGLPAQLGVFQVSDDKQDVVYIGYAGGRCLWGLRGLLQEQLAERGDGFHFRLEVNQQYLSRWEELLKIHMADHGTVPAGNENHQPRRIGQLSVS
ncbi:MAG: hypothetical protein ISR50_16605 [Alphaproteobacteria bacterium]|nr:hypothetical protein [Alphaproteobacteria bacterium]